MNINTLTAGTKITGNIEAQGDFRLDGELIGDITLSGKLVVGETGQIRGNVLCLNANINGNVAGNITVKELLTLHRTAVIKGDIIINKLAIEPGASFSGTCKMVDEVRKAQMEAAAETVAE